MKDNDVLELVMARAAERIAMLMDNPLWSDIMRLHILGISTPTIARVCGCKVATVKRLLREMEEFGLFTDPFAGLNGLKPEAEA